MSSRAFNIADHMKNLQGTRTLASGAKIVGADADSIQAPGLITSAGGGDNTSLNTGLASATYPAGMVLNVISSTKTDVQTFTSTYTATTITGLSCVITPKTTSSKFLITGFLSVGNSVATARTYCKLFRDVTQVGLGDAGGNSQARIMSETDTRGYALRHLPINFLDSPTIPSTPIAITYSVKLEAGSQPYYVNRDGEDNGTNHARGICTLTVMEIAG